MIGILLSSAVLIAADPPPIESDGYRLVWAQEFDEGSRPDSDVWSFERGFRRNEEAQFYLKDNAFLEDGMLIIEGRRERLRNPAFERGSNNWRERRRYAEYTSSSLTTKDSQTWTYGRFVLRARVPTDPGMWPAWWTVGTMRGWPECGEIDMMEYYAGDVLANAAWGKPGPRFKPRWDSVKVPISKYGEGWSDDFHEWRMDWDADSIRLYLDGELLNEIDVTKTINPDGTNPFREPHHMLINLAIGGNNGGDPSETVFPVRYEIDYIRVYQREGDAP
ncbi:MAG: glycoside hydrolase family 16 protein [Planctomycetota bacterium]